MEYSYFIKRNIKFFNNNGYTLYPNGNQVYKRIGDYDVLITDYTGKKLSLDLLVVFELWIKNNITDVLIFRKMYKRTFFCPKIEKIDKEIAKIIEEFQSSNHSTADNYFFMSYTYNAPALKNLSEFIYERKARLMEVKFREELKKNKDNQNEKRKL